MSRDYYPYNSSLGFSAATTYVHNGNGITYTTPRALTITTGGVIPGGYYPNPTFAGVTVDTQGRATANHVDVARHAPSNASNDLSMYACDVLRLREENEEMKKQIAKMEAMIEAMWDAPGMPGSNAVLEDFEEEKTENGK